MHRVKLGARVHYNSFLIPESPIKHNELLGHFWPNRDLWVQIQLEKPFGGLW